MRWRCMGLRMGTNLSALLGSNSLAVSFIPQGKIPTLAPGAAWTGVAASGYGAGAAPVNASVAGRRPSMAPWEPDGQFLDADGLLIGMAIAAFGPGGVVDGTVSVLCEGTETNLGGWRKHTYLSRRDGSSQSMWGFFGKLSAPVNGTIDLYFKWVPADPTNHDTHIFGPYRYERVTALHEFTYTVTPSLAADDVANLNFKTIQAALKHAAYTSSRHNTLILLTENGNYEFATSESFNKAGMRGYLHLRPATGITATIVRTGAPATMRARQGPIRFQGPGLSVDMKGYFAINQTETGDKSTWADGVEFFNSDGRDFNSLYFQGSFVVAAPSTNPGFLSDCRMQNHKWGFNGSLRLRNCTVNNIAGDVTQYATSIFGLRASIQSASYYTTARNALTVQYAGTAASATIAKTGTNGFNTGTLPVVIEAVTTTIALTNAKSVADVVAELNALAGVTATAGPDAAFWPSSHLTKAGAVGFGSFAATDIKTAPLNLITAEDVHGDIVQQLPDGALYLNVIADRVAQAQLMFLSDKNFNDIVFGNYAAEGGVPGGVSQFGKAFTFTNVHVVHTTIADQNFKFGTEQGANFVRTSMRASAMAKIGFGGAADPDVVFADNHVIDTASLPAQATGTTTGGSEATLFVNAPAGDFAPAAELLTNLVPRQLPFDALGNDRAGMTPRGAVAG